MSQVAHRVRWPDTVEEILGGDQAVGVAYVTPAGGVVLLPMTNFGMQDRDAGTVAVNSSVGVWKKLRRMRRNPRVAIAFHTRDHAFTERPEYVLVQGTASFPWPPEREAWLEEMGERWERYGGQSRDVGPLWERWMSAYHWRVNIEVSVERMVVWPELACRGEPEVHGTPLPAEPPAPQKAPAKGAGPRLDPRRAAARARRLPNTLLGWVGADGFPMVVPVGVGDASERGVLLEPPDGLAAPGGRRAGFVAHTFARGTWGQHQRKHTGWLEAEPGRREVLYAPHTKSGYWFPKSLVLYRLASGFVTARGVREGMRQGIYDHAEAL
jgi:hypothetical protein